MKGTDEILALLQDIKTMLGGIGLLLLACFLAFLGWGYLGFLFAMIGSICLWRAWFVHEVVNKTDSSRKKENTDVL